jgi:DNA-dependent RNA polymerase auxiliary subunit epsilon
MVKYEEYKNNITEDIKECLEIMKCQPILFVGSGLSQRYFNAPNWNDLLKKMTLINPNCKEYLYYKQSFENLIDIGTKLSKEYMEWAWSNGKEEFSQELFSEETPSDIYFKSKIVEYLKKITPENIDFSSIEKDEISLLKKINPQAIITTNYDNFLEKIYPEYEPIIGQKILKNQYTSIGEIFKIHGCVSDPASLVITKDDYNDFMCKKKYLSAKLLTYFLEHPIIIIGYSANDPNIKSLLSDIDEILASRNELVENIYFIDWKEKIEDIFLKYETLIDLEDKKSIRIKNITTNKFNWIFEALINESAIEVVNPKLLRALLARTYKLIRKDVPNRKIEIDYETLEYALNNDKEVNKIYGITSSVSDFSSFNINFPYTLTEVVKILGGNSWHYANDFIDRIKEEKNINFNMIINIILKFLQVKILLFINIQKNLLSYWRKLKIIIITI